MTSCSRWSAALMVATHVATGQALPEVEDTPLCISGVYPHLTVFNSVYDADRKIWHSGGEVGIGAVVPWAGKLWLVTYSPHCPQGSTDKLFTIDDTLNLEIRPESIGGTPAGRLIHRESEQLFIGPYAVDKDGNVRTIPYSRMPGRHTAIARHLTDPANRVYYFDMEGRIYEVDVHSLEVTLLFSKPVPGWHAKGGYTGQGRMIVANNGEQAVRGHSLDDIRVGAPPAGPEEMGVLAEWDGTEWRIVERKQFTEVTGPGGILGAPDDDAPVWSVGWDRRSVILKLLDQGVWHTFRLPKGTWTYDHRGGCYSEWPRIRHVATGRLLMDMHGIFWDFPGTFAHGGTGGLRPLSTHHRYVPDFCEWNGQVVIASDDTTMMQNPMVGQAQSNLWFGTWEELRGWGPRAGWGGPWVNDAVEAGVPSDAYAVAGFSQRCLHLAVGGGERAVPIPGMNRCTERFPLTEVPSALAALPRVTVARGDYHDPAPGYAFTVDRPVLVYLAVDARPAVDLGPGWKKTDWITRWGQYRDDVYAKQFPAGRIDIPGHPAAHKPDAYGVPHLAFIDPLASDPGDAQIDPVGNPDGWMLTRPEPATPKTIPDKPVTFLIEADAEGNGNWTPYERLQVANNGYTHHILPPDFKAEWLRLTADTDCVATAHLHFSEAKHDRTGQHPMFIALADVDGPCVSAIVRPGSHTRNLQALLRRPDSPPETSREYWEVGERLAFIRPDDDRTQEVLDIAAVTKDFETDSASVIMTRDAQRYRLPKGDPRYDTPFDAGWPRGIRECESERYLANIHGSFYEIPREAGLLKIKPVASHGRQIMDFCTWHGLFILSGTRPDARPDGHCFGADGVTLWFGAIDDIWLLGKPVGRGGPWKDSSVTAGAPSDPYLMTGYDRKTLTLSHDAGRPVHFTLEVNVDHESWHVYDTFAVGAGERLTHTFPQGYSAHWVRLRADTDCRATAWFVYE